MKTVLTYGTFDMFHVGHVKLLKRLSELGDRLIVGISSEDFNNAKGKKTLISFENRREILLACRYVDDVIAEETWEQKRQDIATYDVDIFAMGDDWAGKFDDLSDICQVLYLPRTRNVSTTEIRQMVNSLYIDKLQSIKRLAKDLSNQIDKI